MAKVKKMSLAEIKADLSMSDSQNQTKYDPDIHQGAIKFAA